VYGDALASFRNSLSSSTRGGDVLDGSQTRIGGG
jgi:hypothetical protein